MLASTPNVELCAKTLRRIKMYGDTNSQNKPIASLVVWPNCWRSTFKFFGIVFNSLQWWWNAKETCLWLHISQPERCICIARKYILKLADLLHLSFEVREILHFITFIPLKSLLLRSGSHLFSCLSARAEIPFRLHGIFSGFLARFLARLPEISARAEICHVIRP